MNFLITGAAGFLGSSLANQLTREGHLVRGLDDLSAGDPKALGPDVHFTRGDMSDRPKLWTLLQEVDVVYHLAARVSVPESILYPRDYNNVNVGGTVALMEAMRDVGVRRVVLASSGAVYGDLSEQPLKESWWHSEPHELQQSVHLRSGETVEPAYYRTQSDPTGTKAERRPKPEIRRLPPI